ncbi:hypothetical protein ADUPG1_013398, partial [Aduncisulcus paluster]
MQKLPNYFFAFFYEILSPRQSSIINSSSQPSTNDHLSQSGQQITPPVLSPPQAPTAIPLQHPISTFNGPSAPRDRSSIPPAISSNPDDPVTMHAADRWVSFLHCGIKKGIDAQSAQDKLILDMK